MNQFFSDCRRLRLRRHRGRAKIGLCPGRRIRKKAIAAACPPLLSSLCPPPVSAQPDIHAMAIEQPFDHWQRRGFASMVPSIHLPTTHEADDLIHVWLHVPEGRRVDAEYLSRQARWSLVFPSGTHSDRVEYLRIDGSAPDSESFFLPSAPGQRKDWTVADMRGTRIEGGLQSFHVLRPASAAPQAPLHGWSWPRGDALARVRATQRLLDYVTGRPRPGGLPALQGTDSQRFARLNDCARCHTREQPRRLWREAEIAMPDYLEFPRVSATCAPRRPIFCGSPTVVSRLV